MQVVALEVLLMTCVASSVLLVTGHAFEWDHFMFAQAWPPGNCAEAGREHHTCHVGPQVHTWTIHGLWPSLGESKGPTCCNDSLPFDFSQIAMLQNALKAYWPNLYNDTLPDSFWKHEWDKHGTCCTDLASTSGEHNYFAAGLMLNQKYNISQMLKKNNVVPSETVQYGYMDFVEAVKTATGFEPVIQCSAIKQNGTTYHLIDQIQICLNKDFSPRSCDSGALYPSGHITKTDFGKAGKIAGENNMPGRGTCSHHSHHYGEPPQSTCSRKHKFNYPPIQYI